MAKFTKKIFVGMAALGLFFNNVSNVTFIHAEDEAEQTPESLEIVDDQNENDEVAEITADVSESIDSDIEDTDGAIADSTEAPLSETAEDSSAVTFSDAVFSLNGLDDGEEAATKTIVAKVVFSGQSIGNEKELELRPDALSIFVQSSTDPNAADKDWVSVAPYNLVSIEDSEGNPAWTKTVTGLPATDENGNELYYRIRQVESLAPNYVTHYPDPELLPDGTMAYSVWNTYTDSWNYAIDLYWKGRADYEKYYIDTTTLSNQTQSPTAVLMIHTAKKYDVGELQVRINKYLFADSDYPSAVTGGLKADPAHIGIGERGNESPDYKFTYYLDEGDPNDPLDDQYVFYNYTFLDAGENFNVDLTYEIEPKNTKDCNVGKLQLTGVGRFVGPNGPYPEDGEYLESEVITYRLDTGAKYTWPVRNGEKRRDTSSSNKLIYYPGAAGMGDIPDWDAENYNYVLFDVGNNNVNTSGIESNQTYTTTAEFDLNGGELVKSGTASFTKDDETGKYLVEGNPQYILVRYPRTSEVGEDGNPTYEKDYAVTGHLRLHANNDDT